MSCPSYQKTILVTSIPRIPPPVNDANIINAWGIVQNLNGQFLIANEGSDYVTSFPIGLNITTNLDVYVGFTGIVVNANPQQFIIPGSTSAEIIVDTNSGQLLAWNASTQTFVVVYTPNASAQPASYRDLTVASRSNNTSSDNSTYLYATNFASGMIDVFNTDFTLAFSFTDPTLVANNYYPFGIRAFNGKLYVTFALHGSSNQPVFGPGNGYVVLFDLFGNILTRLISGGALNAPLGIAFAPKCFGEFSNSLLIANTGSGTILAFNPKTGKYIGDLTAVVGNIAGLHQIQFAFPDKCMPDRLFFTSGPLQGMEGVFGVITPQ